MRRSATSDTGGAAHSFAELIARGVLDPELAALIAILTDHGLPLTVAASDVAVAAQLRAAVSAHLRTANPSRDSVAGGVVIGRSLEDVLRTLGGAVDVGTGEMADESRDVGIVLVLEPRGERTDAPGHLEQRVRLAHYVRPVERDAAGHTQRRPPALLSAWNSDASRFDHFYWANTDELAARAGMERDDLEDAHVALARRLAGVDSTLGPVDARH
jgi:hypothetical protein